MINILSSYSLLVNIYIYTVYYQVEAGVGAAAELESSRLRSWRRNRSLQIICSGAGAQPKLGWLPSLDFLYLILKYCNNFIRISEKTSQIW